MDNSKPCLKCAHDIDLHKIEIIGNYDAVEISCTFDDGLSGDEECGCDAGFGKVAIKKEFSIMENSNKE